MIWLLIAMCVLVIAFFFVAILLCLYRVRELTEETQSGARWPW